MSVLLNVWSSLKRVTESLIGWIILYLGIWFVCLYIGVSIGSGFFSSIIDTLETVFCVGFLWLFLGGWPFIPVILLGLYFSWYLPMKVESETLRIIILGLIVIAAGLTGFALGSVGQNLL